MSKNKIEILTGDCREVLKQYPDNHFDSVVTDPPYGLGKEPDPNVILASWIEKGYHEITGKGFMGKEWDAFVPQPIIFKEILRVLKPGGHILCACGTRTQDWMTMSMRFAGFEIRDVITWHYGNGFPKSLDISKALDNYLGAEREVVGVAGKSGAERNCMAGDFKGGEYFETQANSYEAKQWDGWGTALKPATEFFTLGRKPLSEPTVAKNILKWGVGGINIDGCEIDLNGDYKSKANGRPSLTGLDDNYNSETANQADENGRFPANVMFDEYAAKLLDQQSGNLKSGKGIIGTGKGTDEQTIFGKGKGGIITSSFGDSGGASRFFYIAKASKSERNKGLEDLGLKKEMGHSRYDTCKNCAGYNRDSGCACDNPEREHLVIEGNYHPTVKPVKLMCELVKLITPKGGVTLDPFCGSGTTGVGCKIEGFNAVLIDMEPEYTEIAQHRVNAWVPEKEIKQQLKKPEPKIKEQNSLEFPEDEQ